MRCGNESKLLLLVLLLALLPLHYTYSLNESEVEELTEILQSLNNGLTTLETGLTEIETGQAELSEELKVLRKEAKILEADLKKQGEELRILGALQKDLRTSYDEIRRKNKILGGVVITLGIITVVDFVTGVIW